MLLQKKLDTVETKDKNIRNKVYISYSQHHEAT